MLAPIWLPTAAAEATPDVHLIIPDPRWEMPALLEPGRKPVGNVVVDWEHPVGQHVIHAFVPQESISDLVDGPLVVSGNAVVEDRVGKFTGAAGDKITYPSATPVTTGLTILCRLKRTTINDDMGIYSDVVKADWGDHGISINLRDASAGAVFYVGTEFTYTDDTSVGVGEYYDLACIWSAGSRQEILINSIEASYVAQNIASSYTQSTTPARLGTYYDESAGRTFNGDMEYCFVIGMALSQEQARDVHSNPYQMLIPA